MVDEFDLGSLSGCSSAGPSPLLSKRDVPILAAYCIYRDGQFLRSSLDSVCQYVEGVELYDGRFLDFPDLPEDATSRIISETASRFDPRFGGSQKFGILRTNPMLEVEKRDLMFSNTNPKLIEHGGYKFILDGDEICIGDVKAGLEYVRENAELGIKVFWVYVEEEPGNPGFKPRIIKMEPGLHYGKNHWVVLDKDDNVLTDSVYRQQEDFALVPGFKIYNFGPQRNTERRKQVLQYRELRGQKKWIEREASA